MVPRKIAKHKCPHCGASYEMGVRRETHRAYHTARSARIAETSWPSGMDTLGDTAD